jgi:hypothetical protein
MTRLSRNFTRTLVILLLVKSVIAASSRPRTAQDQVLWNFAEENSYFYLNPTKQRFNELERQADGFANALEGDGKADMLTAVEIAKISEKYQWEIVGSGKISDMARQIRGGTSRLAQYVDDDGQVDLHKLDVWWVSFFATGETKYLAKILKYAEPLQRGKPATAQLVPFAASWSFKSNCGQHQAVVAFAKQCLETNSFPSKKDFLKQCIATPKQAGHYR